MKKNERMGRTWFLPGIVAAVTALLTAVMAVAAISRTAVSAEEPGACTLCIQYMDESTPIAGVEFHVYRVADLLEHGEYALTEPFEDSEAVLESQMTHSAWEEAAEKFADCVKEHSPDPDVSGETDSDGSLKFAELQEGLYFVEGGSLNVKGRTLQAQAFCVVLPGRDLDGNPEYEVTATPKYEVNEPPKESETGTKPPKESETESESQKESETETEPPKESETESESQKESETETEPPKESETESESQKESETELPKESEKETEPDLPKETETEPESGYETEPAAETEEQGRPELVIEKEQALNTGGRTKNRLTARAFDVVTYYLTVRNISEVDATEVIVTDAVPQGLTLKQGSDAISDGGMMADQVIAWNLGRLPAHAIRTVSFKVVTPRVESYTLWKNMASVNYRENGGPPKDSNVAEVEEEPVNELKTGNITVTKTLMYQDYPLAAENAVFYVALYSDEECTVRVTEPAELRFVGSSSESVTFQGLELDRTYYVGESDAQGNVFQSGMVSDGTLFTAMYRQGSSVTLESADETKELAFENVFLDVPNGYMREGVLKVTKRVVDADGQPEASDKTFYVGIFEDEAHTRLSETVSENIVALPMNGGSEVSISVNASCMQDGLLKLYVAEVTEDGEPVDSDFGYAVTVKDGEPEFGAEHMESDVTITNRLKEGAGTTEPESSPGGSGGSGGSGGQPEGVPSDARSVRTGDDTPIMWYVLLLATSACVAAATGVFRKRAKKAGK